MRVCAAGAHLGRHPDRFHEFLPCRAMPHSGFGVAADAVGALRDMGDGDGDQLLCLDRQCAIREYLLADAWKASSISGASRLRVSDKAREAGG
jgi:hypothetical protein